MRSNNFKSNSSKKMKKKQKSQAFFFSSVSTYSWCEHLLSPEVGPISCF